MGGERRPDDRISQTEIDGGEGETFREGAQYQQIIDLIRAGGNWTDAPQLDEGKAA